MVGPVDDPGCKSRTLTTIFLFTSLFAGIIIGLTCHFRKSLRKLLRIKTTPARCPTRVQFISFIQHSTPERPFTEDHFLITDSHGNHLVTLFVRRRDTGETLFQTRSSCTSAAAYTMETAPSVVAAGSTSLTSPSPSLPGATAINEDEAKDGTAEDRATERFAKMVWGYVNSTGELVHDMDSEDDVKLLRLRTKKHELVIVPDPKYIFVVVHDVPS
ncbi:uncharacterized protein L3040_000015 [Drepanopeziza brunnea f. sp. 'multigermtubi']|uniref:uncharacterized protein n=1 Tax=Drepanopeziza brunnea f. sp. 'multigermtubi' TaxID=698441 RepID=UPI00238867B3|nr:hypothetical protein L3040_000015 [Drepanopeziza brunnea f. sp. 'multigermtubi']